MNLEKCLLSTEQELFELFVRVAIQLGLEYEYCKDNYLWIKGNSNIALTSHVDTVDFEYDYDFRFGYDWSNRKDVGRNIVETRKPKEIRVDSKGIVRAYRDGQRAILGGDDRCGVYMIYKILGECFKGNIEETPHVLLFNGEECGGIGVDKFIETRPDLKGIDLILALDCAHTNSFVWYGKNRTADSWIESFGWNNKGHGVFSDITVIGTYTNIPSVNLCAGYYHQHTSNEYIDLEVMDLTYRKVVKMLKEGYVPVSTDYEIPMIEDWEKHHYLCCLEHGCYFNEKNCPVADGYIEQIAPCEECHAVAEKNWMERNWDDDAEWRKYSMK